MQSSGFLGSRKLSFLGSWPVCRTCFEYGTHRPVAPRRHTGGVASGKLVRGPQVLACLRAIPAKERGFPVRFLHVWGLGYQQPPAPEPSEPELSPDERDFRSIVDVLEKNNRSVSMAILGKSRRRWMERPPRDPNSSQPNRLADVLARMVTDRVPTKSGTRYVPGPNYARYLGTPDLVGV